MKFSFKGCVIPLVALCVSLASAAVNAEMEGMEAVSRDDGTFLVGGPTYIYDRILGAGGIHSESELWTPQKLRQRLLFNRMSILPSWDPYEPSIWLKTGNELGDLIYQDFITTKERPENRTPILEGGFRTPAIKGFWATGRAFQDDHYSMGNASYRRPWVEDDFSFFGENWPLFSTMYGGLGYTSDLVNASVLVGEEHIWLFSESSRWIPVHYNPRVEARADIGNVMASVVYENAEYQNFAKKEKGARKELDGSVHYQCGRACRSGMFQASAGMAFRAVDDSGKVYTALDEEFVAWPFMELRVQPHKRVTADVMFGINDDDWLVQDSLEFRAPAPEFSGVVVGVKNIAGSRMNPLADDREFFDGKTIRLSADGHMNLIQGYAVFSDTAGNVGFGGRASFWTEYGAETFDTTATVEEEDAIYRYGNVSRINDWIKGITGELWLGLWYEDMFNFKALGGFERIDGDTFRFEVTPAEFFVAFTADWLLRKSFRISHSLRYRSDAEWNLRGRDPMVVKGDWYWDATFEQMFPKQGLYLTGTLLHVLADEVIQTPNGSEDRLRFVCTVKKTF